MKGLSLNFIIVEVGGTIQQKCTPARRKVRIDNVGVHLLLKTVLVCDMSAAIGGDDLQPCGGI